MQHPAALLLALWLLASAPGAQDAHLAWEVAQAVQALLEDVEPQQVPEQLDTENLALLARNPKQALEMAQSLAREVVACSLAKPDETETALAAVFELVAKMRADAPGELPTLRVEGEMHLARGRMLAATGKGSPGEDLLKSSEVLRAGYEQDRSSAAALARAIEVLHELIELDPAVDAVALCEEITTWSEEARKRHPKSQSLDRAAADNCLFHARACVARAKGTARGLVAKAFDLLDPHLHGKDTPLAISTVWNDAAALDLRRGLGDEHQPILKLRLITEGQLTFSVPRSERWLADAGVTTAETDRIEDRRDLVVADILQLDERWLPARRLRVYEYSWKVNYTMAGGGRAGGDNLKGLVHADFVAMQRAFKVRKKKKPKVTPFSPHIERSWLYVISGTIGQSAPLSLYAYFWRVPQIAKTYSVHVIDHDPGKKLDAVMLQVLSTFRVVSPDEELEEEDECP